MAAAAARRGAHARRGRESPERRASPGSAARRTGALARPCARALQQGGHPHRGRHSCIASGRVGRAEAGPGLSCGPTSAAQRSTGDVSSSMHRGEREHAQKGNRAGGRSRRGRDAHPATAAATPQSQVCDVQRLPWAGFVRWYQAEGLLPLPHGLVCSQECQRLGWPTHKPECARAVAKKVSA